jgi:hypothetical protein
MRNCFGVFVHHVLAQNTGPRRPVSHNRIFLLYFMSNTLSCIQIGGAVMLPSPIVLHFNNPCGSSAPGALT